MFLISPKKREKGWKSKLQISLHLAPVCTHLHTKPEVSPHPAFRFIERYLRFLNSVAANVAKRKHALRLYTVTRYDMSILAFQCTHLKEGTCV